MAPESASESLAPFLGRNGALVDRLLRDAQGARWQLSREDFARALQRSVAKRFGARAPSARELEDYLRSLDLEDLALACACDAGNEAAWEFFVARYRPELRAGARAILRPAGGDDASAEELADGLFADLYGLAPSGKSRERSLFQYFHGRSKLGTWLRSILAQRHVDALRAGRRMVSLDTGSGAEDSVPLPELGAEPPPADPDRRRYLLRFDAALTAALAELPARDRLRLAIFYVDQRTLAETGLALGEHESTASRQLERTRRHLRKRVGELLSRRMAAAEGAIGSVAADPTLDRALERGLDPAQIALAFAYALEEGAFDLSRALSEGETEVGSL